MKVPKPTLTKNERELCLQLNESVIKQELGELVRDSVEKILNELLDQEADRLTNAKRMSTAMNVLTSELGTTTVNC